MAFEPGSTRPPPAFDRLRLAVALAGGQDWPGRLPAYPRRRSIVASAGRRAAGFRLRPDDDWRPFPAAGPPASL